MIPRDNKGPNFAWSIGIGKFYGVYHVYNRRARPPYSAPEIFRSPYTYARAV